VVKTMPQPQFDRAGDRAVEAFFRVFSSLNHVESALSRPVAFNWYELLTYSPTNIRRITQKHNATVCECKANFTSSLGEELGGFP
jgi:hypothetical protein